MSQIRIHLSKEQIQTLIDSLHPELHKELRDKLYQRLNPNAPKTRNIDIRVLKKFEKIIAYLKKHGPTHVAEMERALNLYPRGLGTTLKKYGLPEGVAKRKVIVNYSHIGYRYQRGYRAYELYLINEPTKLIFTDACRNRFFNKEQRNHE